MEKGLIKITGFLSQVWEDGQPTSETKRKEVYINPSFIISVEDNVRPAEKNSFVNIPAQKGCLITVSKGAITATYQHIESASKFDKAIKNYYKFAL